MKLESGPAAYDRNYYVVFLALCLGLGGYFLYDFKIGYPNKNREAARKQLTTVLGGDYDVSDLPETPTQPEFADLIRSNPQTMDVFRDKLGQPLTAKTSDGGETVEYFASLYGMARVPLVNGKPNLSSVEWIKWDKTKEEIQLQLWCALICFVVAIYVFYRVCRASTLRAVIDDEGMTYGGRRIPFEDMVRLCDYSSKGWVDLYYRDGPQERKLRIDNQKIRKFDQIIDALCEVRGFEDPRQAAMLTPSAGGEGGAAADSADDSAGPDREDRPSAPPSP